MKGEGALIVALYQMLEIAAGVARRGIRARNHGKREVIVYG
jgi:hypothetical protein